VFGWEHVGTDDLGGAEVRVHLRREEGLPGLARLDALEAEVSSIRLPEPVTTGGNLWVVAFALPAVGLACFHPFDGLLVAHKEFEDAAQAGFAQLIVGIVLVGLGFQGRKDAIARENRRIQAERDHLERHRADLLTEARGIVAAWG
jgi:hypothetical protein